MGDASEIEAKTSLNPIQPFVSASTALDFAPSWLRTHGPFPRAPGAGGRPRRACASNAAPFKDDDGNEMQIALKRNGEIAIVDAKGREIEKTKVPYGGFIMVKHGE